MFFDGTGNNAQNALKRTTSDCSEPTGSYAISPTNIYRLFKNYTQNGTDQTKAIYIEGIGTLDHCDDSTTSSASGHDIWEGYSANAKTQRAFESLYSYLEELAIKNYQQTLDISITLDLFGFSRGASLARNFANVALENETIFKRILQNEGHHLSNLNLGFIGLFDTVESIKLSPLNLSLAKVKAEGIFHLTALHECRENFPLTSIFTTADQYANAHKTGAGYHKSTSKNYFELRVPGAHSDIGGGYNTSENEVKTINLNATYTQGGAMADAEKIKKDNPDFKNILHNLSFEFEKKSLGYNTISRRNPVQGHLQYVYGHLMLEIARKFNVPFNAALFEEKHPIPEDLKAFRTGIKKQSEQLLTKKIITEELEQKEVHLDEILKKYVHISVSTRTFFGSEDTKDNSENPEPILQKTLQSSTRFSAPTKHLIVHRPTPNWQREIKFV
ncbi:T6SS phospholipase effector Tle1-like catalytic domain-containing protein [Myroides odoratus]|uniref:T6SS phospholipase effector Tle1-like catalytic domain-containing protein n=1 Tax=Myroides odoratus TaxID=256 RepID=UPI0039AF87E7